MTNPISINTRLGRAEDELIEVADYAEDISSNVPVGWFAVLRRCYFVSYAFFTEKNRPDRIPDWHWDFTKPDSRARTKAWADWRESRERQWLKSWGDSKWVKGEKVYSFKSNVPLQPEDEAAALFNKVVATLPKQAEVWAFDYAAKNLREAERKDTKWKVDIGIPRYCITILMIHERARYWKPRILPPDRWIPPDSIVQSYLHLLGEHNPW